MRVRLVFDIGWIDLIYGLIYSLFCRACPRLREEASQLWRNEGHKVVCLSVRSGFDLLLQALRLPAGSEVLMSALTVPDMVTIVETHGLRAIPVDVDTGSYSPNVATLEKAISPETKVLVIAHLFGTRIDLEPIAQFARQHGLYLIEDCAQAYCGTAYSGHASSDAALFSFGPIKTATALGGGLMRLKDRDLHRAVERLQSRYPVQSRRAYCQRILKYATLKFVSQPGLYDVLLMLGGWFGKDPDAIVGGVARNFSGRDLVSSIRIQPSAPLLRMLVRRWQTYSPDRIRRRAYTGLQLHTRLSESRISQFTSNATLATKGTGWEHNTFWVFIVLASDPERTVARMRSAGLDATRVSRLAVVPSSGKSGTQPWSARQILDQIVYIPWAPELPDHVLDQIVNVLQADAGQAMEPRRSTEPGGKSSETVEPMSTTDKASVVAIRDQHQRACID